MYTIEQLRLIYSKNKKAKATVYHDDESVCKYQTKTFTKIVFLTKLFDRQKYLEFLRTMKSTDATKMVVYCECATYQTRNTEIVLNRNQ